MTQHKVARSYLLEQGQLIRDDDIATAQRVRESGSADPVIRESFPRCIQLSSLCVIQPRKPSIWAMMTLADFAREYIEMYGES